MLNGTVESISKDAIVVSLEGAAVTLAGPLAAKLAPELKLGDVVEFDDVANITKLALAKVKPKTPAVKSSTRSPTREIKTSEI